MLNRLIHILASCFVSGSEPPKKTPGEDDFKIAATQPMAKVVGVDRSCTDEMIVIHTK